VEFKNKPLALVPFYDHRFRLSEVVMAGNTGVALRSSCRVRFRVSCVVKQVILPSGCPV